MDVLAQQRPLRARALARQEGERVAAEALAKQDVGELRLRDARLAAQPLELRAPLARRGADALLEQPVHGRVDAAHEEARHRRDAVDAHPRLEPPRQAAQVGVHHLGVALEREDERDVDVDPGGDALLDGREALLGPGIFTIRLGRLTARHSRRASRIVAAVSCASVGATSMLTYPSARARALEDRQEHVGGGADVRHDQRIDDGLGRPPGRGERGQLGVVLRAVGDGLRRRWSGSTSAR